LQWDLWRRKNYCHEIIWKMMNCDIFFRYISCLLDIVQHRLCAFLRWGRSNIPDTKNYQS
jgi:hypothetical protein